MTPSRPTIRRAKPVDMSPEAVALRIEELSQLYELTQSLLTAQDLGPCNPGNGEGEREPSRPGQEHCASEP